MNLRARMQGSRPLCFRSSLRGASRGILQIFSTPFTATVERGAAVPGIRPSLPASLAKSSRRSKAGQVRIPGETLAVSEEPERGLSVPQHLRSSSSRRWVRMVTGIGVGIAAKVVGIDTETRSNPWGPDTSRSDFNSSISDTLLNRRNLKLQLTKFSCF